MKRHLAVLAVIATFLIGGSIASAATSSPPPNALEILWADYCERTADPQCLTSTPSPTPAASQTPSASPSSSTSTPPVTPSPSVSPTNSISPTASPSSSPSPPSPTPTPPSGTIGAAPASGTGPLICPAGYVNWESRGWWTPQGESFDQYRGVDAEICWPTNEFLAPGTTNFLLHIQLRRLHAPIRFIRIGYGPDGAVNGFYQNVNLVPDAAGYGEWYILAPLKANTHAGYNEYRLTANVPDDEDGERQYQSTGLQAWTTSSGSSYRTRPWWESRGWYPATDYVNNRMHDVPPTSPVSGTYSFRWECTRTGSGTLNYSVTYANADTHAIPMVLPFKYNERLPNGAFNGTVSVDTTDLPNGRAKIITRCDSHVSSGTTSALTQFLLNVANP